VAKRGNRTEGDDDGMKDRTRLAVFFVPGAAFLVVGIAMCVDGQDTWMLESGVSMTVLGGILILWGFLVRRDLRMINSKKEV
jgi:hypothetical protein